MQNTINVTVIVKLEPDLSEGNVSYNADGTLNRSQTKSILGAHRMEDVLPALIESVKKLKSDK